MDHSAPGKAPIAGYVDPAIPNPNGPNDAPIIIYGYTPHTALSALAIALYGLLLLLHAYRLYHTRLYTFSSLLLTANVFELIGYAFRLLSSPPPIGDPYSVINFVVSYFFIVVAPVLLSAAIYTTLTTFISTLSPSSSPLNLSRRTILATFISADVACTITQVAGAALIGVAQSNRKNPATANHILLAGLAVQVFTFLLFLVLLFAFIFKSTKVVTSAGEGGIRRYTAAVVGASLLVYLRTCFRLAETSQGVGGEASSTEGLFGGLEFAPVVLAVAVLGWWHPGRVVGRGAGTG